MLKDVATCFNFLLDLFGCDQWPRNVRELQEIANGTALPDRDDNKLQYSREAYLSNVKLSMQLMQRVQKLEEFKKAAQNIAPRDPHQMFALESVESPAVAQGQGAPRKLHVEFLPDNYVRDLAVVREVLRPLCEGDTNRKGTGQRNVAAGEKGRGKKAQGGEWDCVLAPTDDNEAEVYGMHATTLC